MWFKNLIVFRLTSDWILSPGELEEQLSYRPLVPCAGYDLQTVGWVAPGPQERLVHSINQHLLIALGVDQKILPASVINQVTKDRAAEIATEQGYPVGRRQQRELKERVADELRARAFTRRSLTRAWIDIDNAMLVVDAASSAKAEELVATLRDTIKGFSAMLLETEKSPSVSMSAWLMFGDAPGRFNIEQDLELQSVKDEKSIVRYVRHPLEGKEVQKHINAGKSPTKLGMSWADRASFILTADMQVKRLQFLDIVKDRTEEQGQDTEEQFDIDFALMSGELSHLIQELIAELGGDVKTGEQRAA
ncbi:MAG: recombination-associated protein RdgC [Steroidobacteraceae bacterium]